MTLLIPWQAMGAATLLAVLAGCGSSSKPSPPSEPRYLEGLGFDPPASADSPRLLALGDSYTIGEGVAPAERWPVQLVARLRAAGTPLAEPTILAQTGWTTEELSAVMVPTSTPYAFVTLLIGVNDQYRGSDAESYRGRFAALLARAIELAGGQAEHVIVVSIPDWSVTPFAQGKDPSAISAAIDRFNAVNREETERTGAKYVDITVASRQAADDPTLLAADGLHPSGKMYAQWAEAVERCLSESPTPKKPAAESQPTGASSAASP